MTPHLGNVPSDCHPKVRELLEYWVSIHPQQGLPGRQHFDPLDVPMLLPNICLIDAPSSPSDDFTFRLMGSRVEAFFGGNFTGKPWLSAYVDDQKSRAHANMEAMLQDRLPRLRRGPTYYIKNRELALVERIYMPLAEDGETVDIILGLVVARAIDSDFD